jgi:hypothetical protein
MSKSGQENGGHTFPSDGLSNAGPPSKPSARTATRLRVISSFDRHQLLMAAGSLQRLVARAGQVIVVFPLRFAPDDFGAGGGSYYRFDRGSLQFIGIPRNDMPEDRWCGFARNYLRLRID